MVEQKLQMTKNTIFTLPTYFVDIWAWPWLSINPAVTMYTMTPPSSPRSYGGVRSMGDPQNAWFDLGVPHVGKLHIPILQKHAKTRCYCSNHCHSTIIWKKQHPLISPQKCSWYPIFPWCTYGVPDFNHKNTISFCLTNIFFYITSY